MCFTVWAEPSAQPDDGPKHLAEKIRVNILCKAANVTGFLLQHEKVFLAQTTQLHGVYN